MRTLLLEVPDRLHGKLSELAAGRRQSVAEFATDCLTEYVQRDEGSADMETRAQRANLADFALILASVPKVPPRLGGELAEGYERTQPKRSR